MLSLIIGNKNYSSWSMRPWVLMKELAIPFREEVRNFQEGSSLSAFRAFSPSGMVPCLLDGDETVWDSLAIVEHLAQNNPRVWPIKGRSWARSVAAEVHSGFAALRRGCPMSVGVRVELENPPPSVATDLERLVAIIETGIGRFGGPFVCGAEFTACDAFLAPFAFRAQTYGLVVGKTTQQYFAHLLELASMQNWQRDAIADPWRESGHEAEVAALGRVTADYRRT
ncbi:glutathione S-transferase [Paraburkholderia antibiotica]|uniref:glutathione S-transferase n=1 Tax=Paraburkholderia antibiotica TaxID=2728839 RepID=UPI00197ED613|nr:glutathione S-transferase [Paraburkholderia antibiotica]